MRGIRYPVSLQVQYRQGMFEGPVSFIWQSFPTFLIHSFSDAAAVCLPLFLVFFLLLLFIIIINFILLPYYIFFS